ncbi:unnamed protein product [Blepharisma stoltei]|uniref:N6-adenine methyltransferase n=1 Tax=Blepharisma stoltei TaxID=1481888 RepID=A0AAU9J854_9CILI|nr:unnamed protein product [Blepharisma stoltei]
MIQQRSMFADGFVERHDLEQYFWTEKTVSNLIHAIESYTNLLCIATPSLAHALHEEGREEALYDIDTRFSYLPKFRYYDLLNPEDVSEEFRIVVFDPPFFYIPMHKVFEAVCKVVSYNFNTKIMIAFLRREQNELFQYFRAFNIKPTNFLLEYATVSPNKWRNYCLYSNVDLPGIKRLNK